MKKFAVILAAGKGTRMKSDLPKVLHSVCGAPMIKHIIDNLKSAEVDEIVVVVGHQSEKVRQMIHDDVIFVEQVEQKGTAHAVMQASEVLSDKEGITLVLTGDTPLITTETITSLIEKHTNNHYKGTVLTTTQVNPFGYGRILRNRPHGDFTASFDDVIGIVEEKDALLHQKDINEVNTGIFAFDNKSLFKYLPHIKNNNSQHEYYLTDIVGVFVKEGIPFGGHHVSDFSEVMGINSRVQLSEAESILRKKINSLHMENGVTLIDPNNTYIEKDVIIGADTIIYPGAVIKGNTQIGSRVIIQSNSEISNSFIGDDSIIRQSVIYDSHIGNHVQVGPFAHIRPKSTLKNDSKVGNFVEVKGTSLGEGSKVNHLSYIGDANVGDAVNIGCGTITVNYDGKNKHKTIIEDGAFVGCNANLIAPVSIGEHSIVAAGSTISKDVPAHSLAIARPQQENKLEYARKIKDRL